MLRHALSRRGLGEWEGAATHSDKGGEMNSKQRLVAGSLSRILSKACPDGIATWPGLG